MHLRLRDALDEVLVDGVVAEARAGHQVPDGVGDEDLTGTGATPTVVIVSGTEVYSAYDPNGTATTWYRARIEDSGGTRLSDWSVVQLTIYG